MGEAQATTRRQSHHRSLFRGEASKDHLLGRTDGFHMTHDRRLGWYKLSEMPWCPVAQNMHCCGMLESEVHVLEDNCLGLRDAKCAQIWAFLQAFSKPSSHLRNYFAAYSKLPQYSHAVFVEMDVQQLPVRQHPWASNLID